MAVATRIEIFLLTSLLALKTAHCAIQPYKWMYFQPYGSTARLEPLFNNTEYYPLSGNFGPRYSIEVDGVLTIIDIQASDNGIYHFFRMNGSNWIVSKALLNLRGAPLPSLWLEYWPNVVGGFVGMAVVFIIFGLIFLADKYRYRPSSISARHSGSKRPGTVQPYNEPVIIERANRMFVNDDDVTISSHKRTHSQRSSSNSNATELRAERL